MIDVFRAKKKGWICLSILLLILSTIFGSITDVCGNFLGMMFGKNPGFRNDYKILTGYLLGASPFKGLLEAVKQLGALHPKRPPPWFPMRCMVYFTTEVPSESPFGTHHRSGNGKNTTKWGDGGWKGRGEGGVYKTEMERKQPLYGLYFPCIQGL